MVKLWNPILRTYFWKDIWIEVLNNTLFAYIKADNF